MKMGRTLMYIKKKVLLLFFWWFLTFFMDERQYSSIVRSEEEEETDERVYVKLIPGYVDKTFSLCSRCYGKGSPFYSTNDQVNSLF